MQCLPMRSIKKYPSHTNRALRRSHNLSMLKSSNMLTKALADGTGRTVRCPRRLVCLGHPAVQYHDLHGPVDSQCAPVHRDMTTADIPVDPPIVPTCRDCWTISALANLMSLRSSRWIA